MAKNDTVRASGTGVNGTAWPLEDCIRWVEWRVRELTISRGEYVDERGEWLLEKERAGGRRLRPGDKVADYAAWLPHVRDKLSWHQLAYRFYPFATEENVRKYELRVRRACTRVERKHPGSKKYRPRPLSKNDKLLLQAVMCGAVPVYIPTGPGTSTAEGETR